jgi:tetratricopeptide (TPR) repeat protein
LANDPLEFVQRGKVAIVKRQYAEAVKICRLGLLGQPTLLEGRLVLGMALTALKRWDEVLGEMRIALETDPDNALAWLLKGEALVGKRDFVQAQAALERAKALDPSDTKADSLLTHIRRAQAAGFGNVHAEPTNTKEYPARLGETVREEITAGYGRRREETTATGGQLRDEITVEGGRPGEEETAGGILVPSVVVEARTLVGEVSDEAVVEYEESTDVDPVLEQGKVTAPRPAVEAAEVAKAAEALISPPTVTPKRGATRKLASLPDSESFAIEDESATGTFLPRQANFDAAFDESDIADAERRGLQSLVDQAGRIESTSEELALNVELPQLDGVERSTTVAESDPSIVLESDEIVIAPASDPGYQAPSAGDIGYGDTAPADPDDQPPARVLARGQLGDPEDEEETRAQRPDRVFSRPALRSLDERANPLPRPGDSLPGQGGVGPELFAAAPIPASDNSPSPDAYDAPTPEPPPRRRAHGARLPPPKSDRLERPIRRRRETFLNAFLPGQMARRGVALLATALVAVVAVGVLAGLLVREWRMRARVHTRHELARRKVASGNYPGFQAAEQLYRQILAERDDKAARGLRAKVLAQIAFEFGEDAQTAAHAVAGLGDLESDDAVEARIYLAMVKGEVDAATRLAAAYRKAHAGGAADYLVGRAELLADRADAASDALRAAASEEPQDPIVLHALGLAEAAARRNDRALDAYARAIAANANHIATIVDRALLQIRLGADRDGAGGALEGVVGKLVGDASPGQLARAYVGLAELELQKGNVTAARSALAAAAAQRRDSDSLLLEELARAYADAFELDSAEREARRALAAAGRLSPRLVLAQVALRRGRPTAALSVMEDAGSQRAEVLVIRALAKLQLQRTGEARSDAEAALAIQPDSVPARVALARIDTADGRAEAAQKELDRLERGAKNPEVAFALGLVFVARKTPERARFWFKEALRRAPLHLEARLNLARLLHDDGQLAEARDEINQILAANASYLPARRELASLSLDLGDAVAARDEFDAISEREPDLDTFFDSARAHLQLGDGKGAEERLQRAQKLAPMGPDAEEATDLLARAYLLEHRAQDAATLLRKAVPTATRGETVALLMEAYLDLQRLDWAAQAVTLAAPRARTGVELTVAKARLQVESGKDPSAQAFAEEALKLLRAPRAAPTLKAEAYTVLGRSLWDQGSFRSAQKALKTATEFDPRSARAFFYLGLVDEELHHSDEGRQALETAVKNDPQFSDALYYLGRMRADAHDPAAIDAFNKYLEVDPKGMFAEEARAGARGATPTSSMPRSRRRGP